MAIGQKQVWTKVLDFTVQDYLTKDILFQVKYAQDVSIGTAYEKNEIKGGSDNEILYTNYHSPTATFSAQLPLIDDNVIKVKTGAKMKTGTQRSSFDKIYTVDETAGTVVLDVTPLAGTLKVNNVDADENLGAEIASAVSAPTVEQYTISGNTLTFNNAKKGAKVIIVCDYNTSANTKGVIFVSGRLPSMIRITAKTKVEDKTGNKAIKTIIIEKAKPDPNFEFQTSAGNNSVLPFECEVFGFINEDGDTQFHRLVTDENLAV